MPTGLPPIAIIVSRYNGAITSRLQRGALRAYARHGGRRSDVTIVDAPGAFEVPHLCALMMHACPLTARGVVAIACIVKGETSHDAVLGHAVTGALASLSTGDRPQPVGLAVLTVDTIAQARARAGGTQGNKGEEAMLAVLQALAAAQRLGMARFAERYPALDRLPLPGRTAPDKTHRTPARRGRGL